MKGLTTEARNPRTLDIDTLDSEGILERLHHEDRIAADVIQAAIPQIAAVVDEVAAAFRSGGRLIYLGAGTSGRLGVLDAAECPPTYGSDPSMVVGLVAGGYETLVRSREGVEDLAEDGAAKVDEVEAGPNDMVIAISASRRTPWVRGGLIRARERGCRTAFLVCNALGEEPTAVADHVVELITGPEAIAGSTRMKAGLAQKMCLTMITTAAMIRVGKTWSNLMVDVRPTSKKLEERAKGLLMQLGQVDYDRAAELLPTCNWELKTAIIVAREGGDAAAARQRLQAAGGQLRQVLPGLGQD